MPATRHSPAPTCRTGGSARSSPGGVVRCATTCWTRGRMARLRMHDGLVHSCNAYFAQLAVSLGPRALAGDGRARSASRRRPTRRSIGCATRCRKPAMDKATSSRRRCGWRASLRRSPTAASCAMSRGRPTAPTRRAANRFVSREAAQAARTVHARRGRLRYGTLAAIASDAHRGQDRHRRGPGRAVALLVRRLRAVRRGPSRIAFAVIVENAGYGGAAAAPVAGEIVTAAANLGLIR